MLNNMVRVSSRPISAMKRRLDMKIHGRMPTNMIDAVNRIAFPVVTSDTVTGNVTLRLKDVPWDQALDIIMQAKGLGVRKSGNVLWIAPNDEIAAREKQELESKASLESLETLRTQGFQMNYAKAADIAAQISAGGGSSGGPGGAASARILSPRGSVIAEPRTNQLFVTDIPSKLEQVQAFIAKLDIPIRQVLIEARIVEADDRFGRSIGVRLGGSPSEFMRLLSSGARGTAGNVGMPGAGVVVPLSTEVPPRLLTPPPRAYSS